MKKHILYQRSSKLGPEMKGKRNFTSQIEILYHIYTHATHIHTCIIKNFRDMHLQPIIHTIIFYYILLFHFIFLKNSFPNLVNVYHDPLRVKTHNLKNIDKA